MNMKNDFKLDFFVLLGLLFIGLKLTNFIDWSWWWVLAPLYGPFVVVIGVFFVMYVVLKAVEFFTRR
jgi:hypothetical protein